jgi:hypothetical protein
MENKILIRFATIDISDDMGWKFRIPKITSKFTTKALSISEIPEITEKIFSEENFMISHTRKTF